MGGALAAVLAVALTVPTGGSLADTGVDGRADGQTTGHTDVDARGDEQGDAGIQADYPGRAGQADFLRTTYVVRPHSLLVVYHLAVVRPRSKDVTVQIDSGLVLDHRKGASEVNLLVSYGGNYDSGTSLDIDREPACTHTTLPTRLDPSKRTIVVAVPLHCLPGIAVEGDYDDTYVFPAVEAGVIGQDLSRDTWTLPLPGR